MPNNHHIRTVKNTVVTSRIVRNSTKSFVSPDNWRQWLHAVNRNVAPQMSDKRTLVGPQKVNKYSVHSVQGRKPIHVKGRMFISSKANKNQSKGVNKLCQSNEGLTKGGEKRRWTDNSKLTNQGVELSNTFLPLQELNNG